ARHGRSDSPSFHDDISIGKPMRPSRIVPTRARTTKESILRRQPEDEKKIPPRRLAVKGIEGRSDSSFSGRDYPTRPAGAAASPSVIVLQSRQVWPGGNVDRIAQGRAPGRQDRAPHVKTADTLPRTAPRSCPAETRTAQRAPTPRALT